MPLFEQAAFWRAAHSLQDLPQPTLPEIAFAGRSNAGKSSAINALARRRRLAFTSKTPGRTREIIFFAIADVGYLVDLPGYGYARVPDAVRVHWESTLGGYLQTRPSLRGLALIMDARHPMTELDRRMLDWFAPTGRPILVLLSKADKLGRVEARATLAAVSQDLSAWGAQCRALLFSSVDRRGVEATEAQLSEWLGVPPVAIDPGASAVNTPSGTGNRRGRRAVVVGGPPQPRLRAEQRAVSLGAKTKSPGLKGKARGQTP